MNSLWGLNGFWMSSAWVLIELCMNSVLRSSGWMPIEFYFNSEWVMHELYMSCEWLCMSSEWILDEFRMSPQRIPREFGTHSECVLNMLWMDSEWTLNVFWMKGSWILIEFWMESVWVLNTRIIHGVRTRKFLPIEPVAYRTGCLHEFPRLPNLTVRVLCWEMLKVHSGPIGYFGRV